MQDFSQLNVAELKEELRRRKAKVTGQKVQLIVMCS